MSALHDDLGGMLSTLVAVQRGMSSVEANDFLTTGVMPDLSKPSPEEVDASSLTAISETDARLWLGMITVSATDNLD